MVYSAVNQIAFELNQFLRRTFERSEDMVVISNLLEQDGTLAPHIDNKIVVCLVNIERDSVVNSVARGNSMGATRQLASRPPLHLNLYLIFAAHFSGGNYPEALKCISSTIQYFQMTPTMDHHNTPDLHRDIDRLTLDIENLDFQQLSNLWGILSTRYIPSVLYRVRMVTIETGAVSAENYTIREPRPAVSG